MKIIKQASKYLLEIKKSKFIAYSFNVNSKEEVETHIKQLRAKYYDARHICYGYIIDQEEGFDDDGEPSKTAGFPILEALHNQELNYVLVVVIRYFGGIKLGAGGLIRAYAKACTNVISNSELINLEKGKQISIETKINYINQILHIIEKTKIDIIKKDINYQSIVIVNVTEKDLEMLTQQLIQIDHTIKIDIIKDIFVKKELS